MARLTLQTNLASAVSTPSSGRSTVFIDSTTGLLSVKHSNGLIDTYGTGVGPLGTLALDVDPDDLNSSSTPQVINLSKVAFAIEVSLANMDTGDTRYLSFSNYVKGREYEFWFKQDSTGGKAVQVPSGVVYKTSAMGQPAIATTANTWTIWRFRALSTTVLAYISRVDLTL